MKNSKIGVRYAKALFDLSQEQNILEGVMNDMRLVQEVVRENKELRRFLSSPLMNAEKKQGVIKALFEKKVQGIVINFFMILAKQRREMYIDSISGEFIKLYKEFNGIHTAIVRTAVPAGDELKRMITELLKAHYGGEIDLIQVIDPKIIGGFIIQVDDLQYDASISYEIKKLQREFAENIYVRGF